MAGRRRFIGSPPRVNGAGRACSPTAGRSGRPTAVTIRRPRAGRSTRWRASRARRHHRWRPPRLRPVPSDQGRRRRTRRRVIPASAVKAGAGRRHDVDGTRAAKQQGQRIGGGVCRDRADEPREPPEELVVGVDLGCCRTMSTPKKSLAAAPRPSTPTPLAAGRRIPGRTLPHEASPPSSVQERRRRRRRTSTDRRAPQFDSSTAPRSARLTTISSVDATEVGAPAPGTSSWSGANVIHSIGAGRRGDGRDRRAPRLDPHRVVAGIELVAHGGQVGDAGHHRAVAGFLRRPWRGPRRVRRRRRRGVRARLRPPGRWR